MELIFVVILCIMGGLSVYLLLRLRQEKQQMRKKAKSLSKARKKTIKKEKEIKKLEKSVQDLSEAAYTDITTKIGNRDFFIKRALEMLNGDGEVDYTLIGFGITNIGMINRIYGPAEGDRVIRHIAGYLKQRDLQGGFCALVQSNLFALFLQGFDEEIVELLIQQISSKIESASDVFQIKSSFGIYHVTDKNERVSEMLSRMVLAQRSVSDEKKNFAYFNEELQQKYDENLRMCQEMEKALDAKKFVMYLQPIVDMHIYQISGAEALVRWEHEEKGLLSPYAFLPVFENTNLMLKLDYYMWEEACRTIRRWIDNKIEPLPLMLNISPIHLNSTSFIEVLTGLLKRYKLRQEMFVLELPERALTGGAEIRKVVEALAENGFSLSVDNFGSMNSPLNLLREMPISMVKLDRKFLTENSENEEGQTILRYLIAMAKELDLQVAVEGVETLEQVSFLTEIGCDVAQGYYFSKPVNLRDFDQLNKKILRHGFRPTEYYPTFSDMEQNVDILDKMMKQ